MRKSLFAVLISALVIGSLLPAGPAAVATPKSPPVPVTELEPMAMPESASVHIAEAPEPPPAAERPEAVAPGPHEPAWTTYSHRRPNGDGSVTLDLYTRPQFRKVGNEWKKIDPAIRSSAEPDFPFAAPEAIRPIRFGDDAGRMVVMELDGGAVTMSALDFKAVEPTLQNGVVRYSNVAPGVDVAYKTTNGGVKEDIVIHSADAPTSFRFHLSDPNGVLGKAEPMEGGGFRFEHKIDDNFVELEAPFAVEQRLTDGSAPTPREPNTASMSVAPAGDGWDVTVAVNKDWLAGKEFPIVLDPTLQINDGASFDGHYGYVPSASCGPGCVLVNDNDDNLGTGTWQLGGYDWRLVRTAYKFPLSAISTNSLVTSAHLRMTHYGCISYPDYVCDQHNYNVEFHRFTADWNPSTATWDYLEARTDGGVFSSFSVGPIPAYNRDERWQNITGQVNAWYNGQANHGFMFTVPWSQPVNWGGPAFASRETYLENLPDPLLQVFYIPAPSKPTGVSASAGNATANVWWNASNPNGGSAVTYNVQAYDNGVPGPSKTGVAGTSTTFTGLNNGHSYTFRVTAVNADGRQSPVSDPSNAVVPNGVPNVTKSIVGGAKPYYLVGDKITYRVNVANQQPSNLAVTTMTDAIPTGLVPDKGNVLVNGSLCNAATVPACVFNGNTMSITNFTLSPSATTVFEYTVTVDNLGRACQSVVNVVNLATSGGSTNASLPINVCGGGLGLEKWWTYHTTELGPQSEALVNVANGNVVVQATDSSPVQAHGSFAHVIRRTYNSQDFNLLSPPGTIGKGWMLNVGQTDAVAAGGVTAQGLSWPGADGVLTPLSTTFVDRDGTRHLFTLRALAARIDVTAQNPLVGGRGPLAPRALSLQDTLNNNHNRICVDMTYNSPRGVHLALWRYIQLKSTGAAACSPDQDSDAPIILGYAAERPDRLRYEFNALGQLVSMVDGNGVELRYLYNDALAPVPFSLDRVYEPRSCSDPDAAACRKTVFAYDTSAHHVTATDPAGRVTRYVLDGDLLNGHLLQVVNPDQSSFTYRYNGVGGQPTCGTTSVVPFANQQLCRVINPRGHATQFTYAAPTLGPSRLTTLVDRGNVTTTFNYSASPDLVHVDTGGQRQRYTGFDNYGRVGEIDAGSTSNVFLHQTLNTWDSPTTTCRQPDPVFDHNLCRTVRKSLSSTADEDTSYTYNSHGMPLKIHQENGTADAITTFGYRDQYVDASGSITPFDDTPTGGGNVISGGSAAGRLSPTTLYAISDRTAVLPPRGNAPAVDYTKFLTSYVIDNSSTVAPNAVPPTTTCLSGAALMNTGNICEVDDSPFDNAGANRTITRYTYDTFGQKLTMTTPKAIAENIPSTVALGAGATYPMDPAGSGYITANSPASIASYQYSYYADGDNDVSGNVTAGGWLKGVTDPTGHFVAFAYDRGGNAVRTWDRNATRGRNLGEFPGSGLTVPPGYSEQLYGPYANAPAGSTAFSAPWRYLLSSRLPVGGMTSTEVDAHGNVTRIRPPRGNAESTGVYDVTIPEYNAWDLPVRQYTPLEVATDKPTRFYYDSLGRKFMEEDPNGKRKVFEYDNVNRLTKVRWARTSIAAQGTGTCPATSGDANFPNGTYVCSNTISYDGVDNRLATQDANGQTTTYTYDALHREKRVDTPRHYDGFTTLRTEMTYDVEGHVLDVCPPRQFTEGGSSSCTSTGIYSSHTAYNFAGKAASSTDYHATGEPQTSTMTYDADGNPATITDANGHTTTVSFDVNDRKRTVDVPRSATRAIRTQWNYDPAGNVTSVVMPNGLDTGSGSTGALVVDGLVAGNSTDGQAHGSDNPYRIPNGANYTSVTLQNGAHATVSSGSVLEIKVTGTLSICPGCFLAVDGRGAAGGFGGGPNANGAVGAGRGPGGHGTPGTNGGGGGGAGHAAAGAAGSALLLGGTAGAAGQAYGSSDLSDYWMNAGASVIGSGGGGGGGGLATTAGEARGGNGGAGGGYVGISAGSISVLGTITAAGAPGASGTNLLDVLGATVSTGGAGGGGSGGSIWLRGGTVTIGTSASLNVNGGVGGTGVLGNSGGGGAAGRVRIDADQAVGVAAPPPAVTDTGFRRIVAYSYDANNRLVDTVVGSTDTDAKLAGTANGAAGTNMRTRNIYDADGRVIAMFEPRAFETSVTSPNTNFMARLEFDRNGRQVASWVPRFDGNTGGIDPTGQQANQCKTTARPAGFPGYADGSLGLCVTRFEYDAAGRQTKVTLPTAPGSASASNRVVNMTYTDDGLLATTDTPSPTGSGRVTSQSRLYDGNGQILRMTDSLGHAVAFAYTADGLQANQTEQSAVQLDGSTASHFTSYRYDANGNQTRVTDPLSQSTTSTYFADNRLKDITDPTGNKTSYTYDKVGNVLTVKSPSANALEANNPNGLPAKNTYTDDNMLLTSSVPVAKDGTLWRRTSYSYDDAGRTIAQAVGLVNAAGTPTGNPADDGGVLQFSYLPNDLMKEEIGRDGVARVSKTYDAGGRLAWVKDSTSGRETFVNYYLDGLLREVNDGGDVTRYSYDGGGNQLSQQDTTGTTTFGYNDAQLMTSAASAAFGGTSTYSYDAAGRPASESRPDGSSLSWVFNDDNSLRTQTLSRSGTEMAKWDYNYDNLGRRKDQTFSGLNASEAPMAATKFLYGYDAASRITSFQKGVGGPTEFYTWDRNSNRKTAPDAEGPRTFDYRPDDSIEKVTFVKAGVTKNKTYQYHPFGGIKQDETACYEYDDFDRTKRVRHITPDTTNCATAVTEYSYDGLDRQRGRTDLTDATQSSTMSYEGLTSAVTTERKGSGGSQVTHYQLVQGMREAVKGPGGGVEYLTADGNGNITTTTNASDVKCAARFDPFGVPVDAGVGGGGGGASGPCSSGSTPNDFFFGGGRRDNKTGNYQFGARTYDPGKGSFLTPDSYRGGPSGQNLSIGIDPLTRNSYSYVNGNPVNMIDPDGHLGCDSLRFGFAKRTCKRAKKAVVSTVKAGVSLAQGDVDAAFDHAKDAVSQTVAVVDDAAAQVEAAKKTAAEVAEKAKDMAVDAAKAVGDAAVSAARAVGDCIGGPEHTCLKMAATIVVGAVAFAGCTALTGGIGAVGCAAVAGAIAGALGGAMDCKSGSMLSCMGKGAAIGAATGVAFAGLGAAAGKVLNKAAPRLMGRLGRTETFHRAMSKVEYEGLAKTGGLSVRGESFVTQSREYVEQLAARHPDLYETIIEFQMKKGTRDALMKSGAKSGGRLLDDIDVPMIQKGMTDAVHIKAELGTVTYGLRPGSVDIFNSRIMGFSPVG